jgi:PAS domain S-box-containing protein
MDHLEETLEEMIAQSPLGVQILDASGLTLRANAAFLRIFGFQSAREVEGVFNPRTDETVQAHGVANSIERAYAGETVRTSIAPFRSPLGPTRDMRATIFPVKDDAGVVCRVVALIEDMTEQQASAHALSRRFRQIAGLEKAFHRISGALTTQGVLDNILESLRRMEQTEAHAVWRADPTGRKWTCMASHGLSDGYLQKVALLYDDAATREGLFGPILRENKAVVVENARRDPMSDYLRKALADEGIGRVMAVPMISGSAVYGAVAFYGHEPGRFDPLDVETASLLADQAAIALHNAELYEQAREAAAEANVLNQMAGILTLSSGLKEVLDTITETIAPLFGVKRVTIHLIDEAKAETTLIAHTGVDPEELARWGGDKPRALPDQHPLVRQMMATGEPLVLNEIGPDILGALDDGLRAAVETWGLRSLLLLPLFSEGRIIGTMSIDEPNEARHWTERDIRLAKGLSSQAAVAIRNARLMDEARAAREMLEEKVEERTEDLRVAHAEVVSSERLAAVGFLAREVAHGLRNPLNVISTSLYYLKTRFPTPDEKILRHFNTIAQSVDQAATTITQMMNLAGSRQPELAPIDVTVLAQRTLTDRFATTEVHWTKDWARDLPPVRGDWTQISHAIRALISQASQSEDDIHLRTYRDGDRGVFAVGSHVALTEEERATLFEPFFASATQWAGLGLSVARQIALRHNGDVSLDESDGLTWICLSLPLAEPGG